MSLHLLIQSLLVAGAVFLFAAFNRRQVPLRRRNAGNDHSDVRSHRPVPAADPAPGRRPQSGAGPALHVSGLQILRSLLMRPFARLMTVVLNYFHSWEEETDPAKEEETRPRRRKFRRSSMPARKKEFSKTPKER